MKWRSLEESIPSTETRSLREQFAERKTLIAKYVPPEIQAIHSKVVIDLKDSGLEKHVLPVDSKAPHFELPDQNGTITSSSDLLSRGKLVICFFRGRWCPFCTGQLEAMNQVVGQIRAGGATLVAISPQTVQQSFFMADQHRLQFPLLSDSGNRVARQFGLVYRVPEEQQAVYRRALVNLPFVNGDESWELPIAAVYVLDRESTVLFSRANADYTERAEPADIAAIVAA
jgi:peroxiredoxin